ncbi:neutral zinc metallopeptidase [Nonomuraea sp. NPDC046570]|uniref:neutral zinc metallopeptidase n=1 Tax=Nonomuraea sp. NPDC046570 TaxID=3155255 RepID=UPI0033E39E2C
MRTPLVALTACVIAGLTFSGTAAADVAQPAPAAKPAAAELAPPSVLAKNRIYRSGSTSPTNCAVPEIQEGSANSVKRFHVAMAACANRFWTTRFRSAKLRYTPPKLAVTTSNRTVCGKFTSSGALYCPAQRTVAIRITKRDLRNPFRMNIAHSVAHEYGHHVQQLTGIMDAHNVIHWRSRGTARTTASHRLEMQAECFAGVFYSAALDAINPGIEWDQWVDAVSRSPYSKVHGRPANLAYWNNRGYQGASASYCNTWTASNARVR